MGVLRPMPANQSERAAQRAGLPFAAANAIQAAGFGLFHMNPVQGAYAFLIGLALGYVARRCGSLLPAMALHAVFNLSGTLGAGVLDALVPTGPLGQALAGAAISATAIAWIERRHRRRPAG